MAKLSDELKQAIKDLPEKEKDKLLLRLVPKSSLLVHQLEFRLLEGGSTAQVRREELRDKLQQHFDRYPTYFYSPGYLMMDMREMSGYISLHVNVTKDKMAEIELNLLMVEEFLVRNMAKLKDESSYQMEKFSSYVIKRMAKILKLLDKVHEDYYTDFRSSINTIGNAMAQIPTLASTAKYMQFDLRLLKEF